MLKTIASLWIGKSLGPIELASIRSFQRHGHEFTLFSYDPIVNCPPDVIQADARTVLDLGRIVLHRRTKSPALHSDLFRYAMVAKTDFTWVDLDVIALRPFDFPDDNVFGYEAKDSAGSAVLKLPKGSAALAALSAFSAETRGMPPRLEGFKRFKYHVKNILSGGLPIERWPWGSIGPALFTAELKRSEEIAHIRPLNTFYPVPMSGIPLFADPGSYSAADAPPEAYAVHLWGSHLTRYVNEKYNGVFPAESFVSKVLHDEW
ncbi:hypothetical protein HOY34_06270 [Xinfangfangia sp. D13-10-4-6]|uniref:hypothetical protein n=1 Tax=Pseudogemmobacter hezensis TaxID=2737662 RepID=UPI001557F183|nr:hypothetical protein [Pseudogemmobacter hezensis]NPD14810.1 hypothetical protein [Pseudogemmobacter hezensis]